MTVVTLCRMTLLLLMFTLTISGPSQAATFFDTKFDTCAVGTGNDFPCEGWDDFAQEAVGHLEITNTRTYSGSKSVMGTYDNPDGNSQQPSIWHHVNDATNGTDHGFLRYMITQSPGFQVATNGHTKTIRFFDSGNYPVFGVIHRFGAWAVIVEGPYDADGSTDAFQSGTTPSTYPNWDTMELEVQLNTPGVANGLFRLWVNNVKILEVTNRQWRGPTPTSRGINSGLSNPSTMRLNVVQYFVQSGLGNKWLDRFAVGDTRIGLATSQSSSDIVPPATPAGLQIR